jgi:very-short-patch-repair endonuclease
MIEVVIDTSDVSQELNLTRVEIEGLMDYCVKQVTASFYQKWCEVAGKSLKGTREQYVKSIYLGDTGLYTGYVILRGLLPNMIEQGCAAFDMKCVVNREAKVYTSKGFKSIKNIVVGDLVLTHKGKMRRVVKINKEVNKDEFVYRIKINFESKHNCCGGALVVTGNHPILTNFGWIKAKDLDNKKHRIIVSAKKCLCCGKLISLPNLDKENLYCNKSCAAKVNNEFRREFGRTDLGEKQRRNISRKVIETNKRMYVEGKHVTQTGKLQEWLDVNAKGNSNWGFGNYTKEEFQELEKKAHIGWGKSSKNSNLEQKLFELIRDIEGIQRQYPYKRNRLIFNKKTKKFKNRFYYFDFAVPEKKLCIEVNGEFWHTKEQIRKKQEEIEKSGWTYIGFWGKEIYNDVLGCVKQIRRVLDNHDGNYYFKERDFSIKKIKTKNNNLDTVYSHKYDLTVDKDSSFIVNGIVVHNSGLLASPKARIKLGGGKYITVPFRWATAGSIGESQVFSGVLPQVISKIVTSKKPNPVTGATRPLKVEEIPSLLQIPTVRKQIILKSKVFEEYQRKTSVYVGISKTASGSGYKSFRRISDKSDANSFIFPGLTKKDFAGKALADLNLRAIIDYSSEEYFSKIL